MDSTVMQVSIFVEVLDVVIPMRVVHRLERIESRICGAWNTRVLFDSLTVLSDPRPARLKTKTVSHSCHACLGRLADSTN